MQRLHDARSRVAFAGAVAARVRAAEGVHRLRFDLVGPRLHRAAAGRHAGENVGQLGWNWHEPELYSNGLYEALHQMDKQGFEFIQAWLPPDEPQWAGVRDRLKRATNG